MALLALLSRFQSLPRASRGARVAATLCVAVYAAALASTFIDLDSSFTSSWVVRGIFIAMGLRSVPRWAMVAVTGRMTRTMVFMFDPSSYGKTLSDVHADSARAIEEERKRSREM